MNSKLYVGNLAPDVGEASLRVLFSRAGKVHCRAPGLKAAEGGSMDRSDRTIELPRGIATEAQQRKLELWGDLRFRTRHPAPFSAVAKMTGDSLTVKNKNLAP